jgi:hypothetical protein
MITPLKVLASCDPNHNDADNILMNELRIHDEIWFPISRSNTHPYV